MISLVFIVLNVRDGTESKYPSVVFLSILSNSKRGQTPMLIFHTM